MSDNQFVFSNSATLPAEILIGVEVGRWPLKIWEGTGPANRESAAIWLGAAGDYRRAVYRVELNPVEELEYVPPVEATVQSMTPVIMSGPKR